VVLKLVMNCNQIENTRKFAAGCLDATQERYKNVRETHRKLFKRLDLMLFSSKTSMKDSIQ
jgi:hypothetical protein